MQVTVCMAAARLGCSCPLRGCLAEIVAGSASLASLLRLPRIMYCKLSSDGASLKPISVCLRATVAATAAQYLPLRLIPQDDGGQLL